MDPVRPEDLTIHRLPTKRPLVDGDRLPRRRVRRHDAPLGVGPFRLLGLILLPLFALCGGALIQTGVYGAPALRAEYQSILSKTEKRTPPRGEILDGRGQVIAESVVTYDCWAISKVIDPRVVPELADMLAEVTKVPSSKLEMVLAKKSPHLYLFRDMELEFYQSLVQWQKVGWNRQANRFANTTEGRALIAEGFDGNKSEWYDAIGKAVGNVQVKPVHRRRYPLGSVAGQVVGFVTERQEGLTPGDGMELWANQHLQGDPERVLVRSVSAGQIGNAMVPGKPALGIQLTIDSDLQAFAERACAVGLQRTKSTAGVVVVIDSQSGDILALANVPVFDPERYQRFCRPDLYQPSPLEEHASSEPAPIEVDATALLAAMTPAEAPSPVDNPVDSAEPVAPLLAKNDAGMAPYGDGIAPSQPTPARDGRPFLLLNQWPLPAHVIDGWTNPVPPGLIPGKDDEHRRIGGLIWAVEPGSIFKPFAMLAALEHGTITKDTTFTIGPAPYFVAGHGVSDHHSPSGNETWTAHKVMVKSSNKGMAQIAMRTGQQPFIDTFKKLHFGEVLLGLPGERTGSIRPNQKWYPTELATASFGQGLITTTPVQLTAAMNAIATGSFIRPRLLKAIETADGSWRQEPTPMSEAAFDPASIEAVRDMLEDVVKEGTGKGAAVEGYRVAGKTGTAWKAFGGSYAERRYVSSFLGYGPVEAPRYTVLVMYDEPQVDKFGGLAAAPVFKEIMGWLLRRDAWEGITGQDAIQKESEG